MRELCNSGSHPIANVIKHLDCISIHNRTINMNGRHSQQIQRITNDNHRSEALKHYTVANSERSEVESLGSDTLATVE